MYHRVNDKLPCGEFVVNPEKFEEQMAFLDSRRERFEVIGLKEMVDWLKSPPEDSKKSKVKIVISLDDGYRDNYMHAFPALKKYGFPAVISLITGYVGTEHKAERYKDVPWKRDYLNAEEIKEMMESGVEFAAHTAAHPHLTRMGLDEAEKEIKKSKEYVGEGVLFCYPYGEYNKEIKEIVKKCGFKAAFTVNEGANHKGQDLFEINRVAVSGYDGIEEFNKKLDLGRLI